MEVQAVDQGLFVQKGTEGQTMDQAGVGVDGLAEVLWWTGCLTVTTGVTMQKGVGAQTVGHIQDLSHGA